MTYAHLRRHEHRDHRQLLPGHAIRRHLRLGHVRVRMRDHGCRGDEAGLLRNVASSLGGWVVRPRDLIGEVTWEQAVVGTGEKLARGQRRDAVSCQRPRNGQGQDAG